MIYFIQEKSLFRNRVKIGYSEKDAGERLRLVQSQSPSALKMLFVIPGDKQDESDYHDLFTAYRLHGEWFKYGLRLRLFIWSNRLMAGSQYKTPVSLRLPKTQKPPKSIPYLLLGGLFELILEKLIGRYPAPPDLYDYEYYLHTDDGIDIQINEQFIEADKKYNETIKKMKSQKIRDWIRRTAWPDDSCFDIEDFVPGGLESILDGIDFDRG